MYIGDANLVLTLPFFLVFVCFGQHKHVKETVSPYAIGGGD